MCGIWILLDNKAISKRNLLEYSKQYTSIDSRGPDAQTMSFNFNMAERFARLSINDVSPLAGQPFHHFHGGSLFTLLINGEIYNFKEIIRDYHLEDKMKSDSDCEVIIHLYIMFDCDIMKVLDIIRGEYAFCIVKRDVVTGNATAHVARDPFGVRHLYYSKSVDGALLFGSFLKSVIHDNFPKAHHFPPGCVFNYQIIKETCLDIHYCYNEENVLEEKCEVKPVNIYENMFVNSERFHTLKVIRPFFNDISRTYKLLTDAFIRAVQLRLISDRQIGVTIGGVDSSLVAGVAVKILKYIGLQTYTTGSEGSMDIITARKTSAFLGTEHTEFQVTEEIGFNMIEEIVELAETWDVTTVRACFGNAFVAKSVSEQTNTKVILNGDGADELFMGYMYNFYSPSDEESLKDTLKRMNEIHKYDGNRSDKCMTSYGLEGRNPYLDIDFVDVAMQIDPKLKRPTANGLIEKQILRDAFYFLYPDVLPEEVLYRRKEAFSNGISGTDEDGKRQEFYHGVIKRIEQVVSDDEFENRGPVFEKASTKEGFYYMKIFHELFNFACFDENNFDVIGELWLPSFVDTNGEPSATVLSVYENEQPNKPECCENDIIECGSNGELVVI
jgi:asparagine synthase (glutamine-hydrolysing)